MEPYFEIEIICKQDALSYVQGLLQQNFVKGWIEDGDKLTFFIPKDGEGLSKVQRMQAALQNYLLSFNCASLNDMEWEKSWKNNFKPRTIGNITITPPWELDNVRDKSKKVIIIEPKMAFGTGEHATTAMCVELLQQYVTKDSKVLDLGTGSGILAIAASLLGAQKIVGVDNDDICITEANENLERMRIENVEIKLLDAMGHIDGKYNVVCANLFLHQVQSIISSSVPYLESKGLFIASGITVAQEDAAIRTAQGKGFTVKDIKREGLWVAICFEKP